MAKYAILIYEDEAGYATGGEAAYTAALEAHTAFGEENAGVIAGGHGLQATTTATSLRGDGNGGFTVTDGAFAETKEALGGFYIVEADDLDGAIAIAKAVPAPFGGVEVRPVMVFD